MKTGHILKISLVVLLVLILFLSYAYFTASNLQKVKEQEIVLLQDSVQRLNNELAFRNLKNEVLNEINENISSQLYANNYTHIKKHETKPISADEKAVQGLIKELEQGWEKMVETKDPNALLNYFMPKYTTNAVKIDTKNMPFVQRHNDTNFREHLNQLTATKELRISFGEPTFYSTVVRGNIFTTSYLSYFTATHQGKVIHKSTILCFVSGEKMNNRWLVGNYNWTRYDDFDASKNKKELTL